MLDDPRDLSRKPSDTTAAGLSKRHRTPEIMDDPGLDSSEHERALRGLGRINRVSRSASILWPAIAEEASRSSGRPIRILDLACGGGDVCIALARRAQRRGLNLQIDGVDVSPIAVDHAANGAGSAGVPVQFFRLDALNDPLPEDYNIAMCSLFLHHLNEQQAICLLERMASVSRSRVLVNDLLRSPVGYGLAWAGCRLLSRSSVVHHDGPASVRAAFRLEEVRDLACRAGLERARIVRRWPWRFLLSWSRDDG